MDPGCSLALSIRCDRRIWRDLALVAALFAASWLGLAGCRRPTERPRAARAAGARQQDAYRQPERLIAALIGAAVLRPGARVADVGAGGGYLSLPLAKAIAPGGTLVATDIDAAALQALRQRAAGLADTGSAQQGGPLQPRSSGGDGTAPVIETRLTPPDDPQLEPARYDLILLSQVDHLLPDRKAYLRLLKRALRPGGTIAVVNRERYRGAVLEAAGAATLQASELFAGLPGQFLVLLRAATPVRGGRAGGAPGPAAP